MPIVYTQITNSTAIELIGYDTVTGELRIRFTGKGSYPEYIWGGVEPIIIENFFLAGSKGKYYHAWIANQPQYKVRRAMGSYRLAAIMRGVPKAPARVARGAKQALEYTADLILPIK